ncbi:MAG: Ni,Fe-hydrogenase I large subunit [Candidatus Moranbacteria bacterium GW2011_GWD2_38_7]|nr:MAG: Ni,Fe-hydrogenase I large subunit [Candidatus Moranbacteria bacterium GW2011_GWD2_38_7]
MRETIIIDPVTRIEGHLSVKIDVEHGKVKKAESAGTMFRGFELISKGRDPRDMIHMMQRVCGVCPVPQGIVAALALESAAQIIVPLNAKIIRNLVQACNFIDSNVLHFYLLTLPDYVPGPQHAPWTPAWNVDMRGGPAGAYRKKTCT